MEVNQRLIIALDMSSTSEARKLVRSLKESVKFFKIGLELFHNSGREAMDMLRLEGVEIFADFKFHDIPNTVAAASRVVTRQEVKMFNVHAGGGKNMMEAAVQASREEAFRLGIRPPLVLAVTVLTSFSEKEWQEEMGVNQPLQDVVKRRAVLARAAGLDGVIASPREISSIRAECGEEFLIVAPGIRPEGSERNDQKRIMTPSKALKAGANYIVVGRPVTQHSDPLQAARNIIKEMEGIAIDRRRN